MMAEERLLKKVVNAGLCVGCGACVGAAPRSDAHMVKRPGGPEPVLGSYAGELDDVLWEACPGKGIDYPKLYQTHYGRMPDDWRIGVARQVWIGYSSDPLVRRAGASGGVMTSVLLYLLESGRIDAALLVRQGIPSAEEAAYCFARSREEVLSCAQSVYVPVPVLDALRDFVPGERYAMTCLPEQSAALRVLQHGGIRAAQQVEYVLGPYTGTALEQRAIRALLRNNGVRDDDPVMSLKWRAGEWPGYLEIRTASGRLVRSPKVYYNYLIPFYITSASLRSMDFTNEFADISVGDAWSPKLECLGGGYSVVVARSDGMKRIIDEMKNRDLLDMAEQDVSAASEMHGHMIDFKKRGGYIRNSARRFVGRPAPDYGLRPVSIGVRRVLVECVVSSLFLLCRSRLPRWTLERIPERILGPLFDRLRLAWKSVSRPAKRKGMSNLRMICSTPRWRDT